MTEETSGAVEVTTTEANVVELVLGLVVVLGIFNVEEVEGSRVVLGAVEVGVE